ncbi:MAG: ABC transporter ATP-binding protein [bacterium]
MIYDYDNKLSLSAIKELFKHGWRLNKEVWHDRHWSVLTLFLLSVVLSAAPFLQSGSRALVINELVAGIGQGLDLQRLILFLLFLVGADILPPLFYTLQNYVFKQFWFYLEEKFELLLLRRRGEIDIATHEDPQHNDLFNKVMENGVWRVQNFMDRQFYLFQNIISVVIAFIVLALTAWWVFPFVIIGTLPELLVELKYGKDVWNIHSAKAEVKRKFWNLRWHFNWLPSLTELKLFQNTGHFLQLVKELFLTFQVEQKLAERRRLFHELWSLGISQTTFAVTAIWLVFQVVNGNLQIGTLTFLLASIGDLRQSLSSLFSNLGRQYQDGLFIADMFRLVDLPPALPRSHKPIALPEDRTPDIVFDNVSFSYPGTDKLVLKDFFLRIPAGEKLAIVGANGAGKTTFVKLLCRFYDPTNGQILVDGHDLKSVDLESWYQLLGALFQEYAHYNFLAKEAIGVGRSSIALSLEKAMEAAHASESNSFIEQWEKQYDQMLGKEFVGGIEPSVGQWQKLALARTFYRDPNILILDEPTSSIDAEAEAKIFQKLESLPPDRTVILISHRFSTVRQANKIIVLEDGMISEQGSHEELVAMNGTYARLFKLQAKGYQ